MWRMPKALGRYLFGREGGKLVRRKWLLEDLFSGGGVLGGGLYSYLEVISSYYYSYS